MLNEYNTYIMSIGTSITRKKPNKNPTQSRDLHGLVVKSLPSMCKNLDLALGTENKTTGEISALQEDKRLLSGTPGQETERLPQLCSSQHESLTDESHKHPPASSHGSRASHSALKLGVLMTVSELDQLCQGPQKQNKWGTPLGIYQTR